MKINIIQNGKSKDATNLVGNLSFNDSLESLGSSLNFELPINLNDEKFKVSNMSEIGDLIEFENEGEKLFTGIIVNMSTTRTKKTITCLDYAFYLNKNKLIKQFRRVKASSAIKSLCGVVGVPIGQVETINTSITKVYKNKTVAEIISDILNQVLNETGIKYQLRIRNGALNLKRYKPLEGKLKYKILGAITKSEDLGEMRNTIVVTSNSEKSKRTLAKVKDNKNIKKYGKLQDVIEVEPKDISKVRSIARRRLKELNKVKREFNVSVLGDNSLRAGRYIKVTNEEFKMNGKFLINSATHKWKGGNHIVDLTLEVYNGN